MRDQIFCSVKFKCLLWILSKAAVEASPAVSVMNDSPAGQVTSAVSLQSDGRLADLSVSDSLQPTPNCLLDLDAG